MSGLTRQIISQIAYRLGFVGSQDALIAARDTLLASEVVAEQEKALLRRVSLDIHRHDDMYVPGHAEHYLTVGLSALSAITEALHASGRPLSISPVPASPVPVSFGPVSSGPVTSILDFSCGYGRVLRMLKAQFSETDIFASELNSKALAYCESVFSVQGFQSNVDFKQIEKIGQFDLIWCSSLIPHIDESSATDLLRFFHQNLAPGGVCVFSTHGLKSLEALQAGLFSYNLSAKAQEEVLAGYRRNEFGFGNYRFREGYGMSLSTREKIEAMAATAGDWTEIMFKESGWDNHQDVFAFSRT